MRPGYDHDRYRAIREIAFETMAFGFGGERAEIGAVFASEVGYATPKVNVRAAVLRGDGKILMVRERADGL